MKILVLGCGNIGSKIAEYLENGGYDIIVSDSNQQKLDKINIKNKVHQFDGYNWDHYVEVHSIDTIINALPHFMNQKVVEFSINHGLNYLDLTEDVPTSIFIRNFFKAFPDKQQHVIPHCGLAPGLINIVGSDLIKNFNEVYSLDLRVGALPKYSNNEFKYAINWSVDGLVNEYIRHGEAIMGGKKVNVPGLSDREEIIIDGTLYEAFFTAGGLGTMAESFPKILNMNYKTIRYPGHLEKLLPIKKYLHDELSLKCPPSSEDIVILYASAFGDIDGIAKEKTYVYKWFNQGDTLAIQNTTALSACAVIEMIKDGDLPTGFVKQENISLDAFSSTRFGEKLMLMGEKI